MADLEAVYWLESDGGFPSDQVVMGVRLLPAWDAQHRTLAADFIAQPYNCTHYVECVVQEDTDTRVVVTAGTYTITLRRLTLSLFRKLAGKGISKWVDLAVMWKSDADLQKFYHSHYMSPAYLASLQAVVADNDPPLEPPPR